MVVCKIENYVVSCKIVQCGKISPNKAHYKIFNFRPPYPQRGLINMSGDGSKDVIIETYLYCSTLETWTLIILFSKVMKFSRKKIRNQKFVVEIKELKKKL
jgi:hypothetical protein